MPNWLEHYMLNELLLSFSIIIAFLVLAVFGQRKTWMTTDSFMTIVCGAAFIIFPKQLLTVETNGEIRPVDENIAAYFGIVLLCSGLNWLKHESSRDGTVIITLLISRILTSGIILITLCFAYFFNKSLTNGKDKKPIDWSEQVLCMGILPLFLWFSGHLLHLFKSSDFNSFPQHNIRINLHLRIQAFITFFYGIILLTFPGKIVGTMFKQSSNKVMLHFARCVGSVFIGNSIVALQAPGFLHERDKKSVFLNQIGTSMLQLLYICWIAYRNVVELNFMYSVAILQLITCLNASIGYFFTSQVIHSEYDKLK